MSICDNGIVGDEVTDARRKVPQWVFTKRDKSVSSGLIVGNDLLAEKSTQEKQCAALCLCCDGFVKPIRIPGPWGNDLDPRKVISPTFRSGVPSVPSVPSVPVVEEMTQSESSLDKFCKLFKTSSVCDDVRVVIDKYVGCGL